MANVNEYLLEGDVKAELAQATHENLMLKTELVHCSKHHKKEVQHLKLIQDSKIKDLEKSHLNVKQKLTNDLGKSHAEQKSLQQMNLQMCQKLKACEDELATSSFNFERKLEDEKRNLVSLENDLQTKENQIMELEKQNMIFSEKVSFLENEIDKEKMWSHELEITLNTERHNLKMLENQLNDVEKQYQGHITDVKDQIGAYREKIKTIELNSERQLGDLKDELQNEVFAHLKTKQKVVQAEQNLSRIESEMKERQVLEMDKLLGENNALMTQLQALKATHTDDPAALLEGGTERNSVEVETKLKELNELKKANVILKSKLEENEDYEHLLQNEMEKSSSLKSELKNCLLKIANLTKDINQLRQFKEFAQESLSEKEKLLKSLSADLQKERATIDQRLAAARQHDEDEKSQNHARISSLETQLRKKTQEYLKESHILKNKAKRYAALIKKLRFRLETARVKNAELEAKQVLLTQDCVPSFKYKQLQERLHCLLNKHTEFKAFVQGVSEKQMDLKRVDEMSNRISSINEKLNELDGAQSEALSVLENL